MATTTNYGWETPDDTDLVKDGALAMRDLGQDVDTSLYAITNGKNVGLVPLTNTTFTTVSSIQIDNVFTSEYDHYFLNFQLTACTGTNASVGLKLVDGTTPTTTSEYYWAQFGIVSATSGTVDNVGSAATSLLAARMSDSAADVTEFSMNILSPNKANRTSFNWMSFNFNGSISFSYFGSGNFNLATQFEGLQFLASAGTISGNVKIYGYRNS
jgi:hypothetical protein